VFYHRLVCLACVPCITGKRGQTIEPRFITLQKQPSYEADHIHGSTRDCRRANLELLPRVWHRKKRRKVFRKKLPKTLGGPQGPAVPSFVVRLASTFVHVASIKLFLVSPRPSSTSQTAMQQSLSPAFMHIPQSDAAIFLLGLRVHSTKRCGKLMLEYTDVLACRHGGC
jgi:hypothetical protein